MNDTHDLVRPRGVAILITGLPAAGKTTLGAALARRIEGDGGPVTLLDGDEVRKLLSSELGYSREHRRLNVLRHGYIAAEVCRHRGIAICSLIAPYAVDRAELRRQVEHHGSLIEIYLATPLTECERRDPKGLYALARAGRLRHMTGIDDPYEAPVSPELRFEGTESVNAMTQRAIVFLAQRGFLAAGTTSLP